MYDVSFIIPSYNNFKNLKKTIRKALRLKNFFKKINFEILIIDDFSNDQTFLRIKKEVKKKKYIKIFKNSKNIGFAQSCKKGVKKAKGKFIKILHSGDIERLDDLKKYFLYNYQDNIIIPYLNDNRSFFRKALSSFCVIILSFVSGLNLKYYQSPILCKKKVFLKFFSKNNGSFFLSEMIIKMLYSNLRYESFPISVLHKQKRSKAVKFKNLLSFISCIIEILYVRLKLR